VTQSRRIIEFRSDAGAHQPAQAPLDAPKMLRASSTSIPRLLSLAN
jgi:hypothetical protein